MRTVALGVRQLFVGTLGEAFTAISRRRDDFAVLLWGADAGTPELSRLVAEACERGCREYVCVGKGAENLHDGIDAVLEARGALDVVTTWHEGDDAQLADGCRYFVRLAGTQAPFLLAATGNNQELMSCLELAVAELER